MLARVTLTAIEQALGNRRWMALSCDRCGRPAGTTMPGFIFAEARKNRGGSQDKRTQCRAANSRLSLSSQAATLNSRLDTTRFRDASVSSCPTGIRALRIRCASFAEVMDRYFGADVQEKNVRRTFPGPPFGKGRAFCSSFTKWEVVGGRPILQSRFDGIYFSGYSRCGVNQASAVCRRAWQFYGAVSPAGVCRLFRWPRC